MKPTFLVGAYWVAQGSVVSGAGLKALLHGLQTNCDTQVTETAEVRHGRLGQSDSGWSLSFRQADPRVTLTWKIPS